MTNTPRMRTILEAVAELKAADPGTAVTAHAVRRMIKAGELPHVRAGQKYLINMDTLIAHLTSPQPVPEREGHGTIRAIPERRRA